VRHHLEARRLGGASPLGEFDAPSPQQVGPATVGERDGAHTDLLAFRGVIEKDGNAF
jgi:hypothetical protein